MTHIILHPAIHVLSGDTAGFVYCPGADGSLWVSQQAWTHTGLRPAQMHQVEKFKAQTADYNQLLIHSGVQAAYAELAAQRGAQESLRALALCDLIRTPRVGLVDLSAYSGAAGEEIMMLTEKHSGISRLQLQITDLTANQAVECVELPIATHCAVTWHYRAQGCIPLGHEVKVQVSAYDYAGCPIEEEEQ